MDLQKKRILKGKIKFYNKLGFAALITIAVMFISIFFIGDYIPQLGRLIYIGVMLSMIPIGLYCTGMLQLNEARVREYKQKIRQYRTRVLFHKIITLTNQGNLKEAIKLYRQIPQGNVDDILFGYMINEHLHSSDVELNKKGNEKLLYLLDKLDPDKVDLN